MGKLREQRAVITPVEMPKMPRALPIRAVDWEAKPVIPPMHASDAAR